MDGAKETALYDMMREMGARARKAAAVLAQAPAEQRTEAILGAAQALEAKAGAVLEANARDMTKAAGRGVSAAMLDRLRLDADRLGGICVALRSIAGQTDPVGAVIDAWTQPSGLAIRRVRSPIGVIGIIFESRPNVTADAGGLCIRSGNAAILRGGSESAESAAAIHDCLVEGLRQAGLPATAVQLVPTQDRAAVGHMLADMTDFIDVIVPRGGRGLVGRVQAEARVPVFAHLEGICHVYVDGAADVVKAIAVTLNAKTRRPGVCGAAECLLIDRDAPAVGAQVLDALLTAGVEIRGCAATQAFDARVIAAHAEDYGHEFLDMVMAARVVDGVDGAIEHVRRYGSGHTESIITEDSAAAQRFFASLDSAILMHNASTQFADGGEFGMGAEIGIATGKLHARGPVGATQLTTFRYLVEGNGTIRP